MYRSTVLSLCASSLLLAACAGTPRTPNKYGHYHNYPYQAPAQVSEVDADECGQRANTEAFAATFDISDRAGVLFGAIGAAVQIARIKRKLNSTYEKVMKECLREKGYELAEKDQV